MMCDLFGALIAKYLWNAYANAFFEECFHCPYMSLFKLKTPIRNIECEKFLNIWANADKALQKFWTAFLACDSHYLTKRCAGFGIRVHKCYMQSALLNPGLKLTEIKWHLRALVNIERL